MTLSLLRSYIYNIKFEISRKSNVESSGVRVDRSIRVGMEGLLQATPAYDVQARRICEAEDAYRRLRCWCDDDCD